MGNSVGMEADTVPLRSLRLIKYNAPSCFSNGNSAYYAPYDGMAVAELQLSAFLSKNTRGA